MIRHHTRAINATQPRGTYGHVAWCYGRSAFLLMWGYKSSKILATTMWNSKNEKAGMRRKNQLTEYWGSGITRFDNEYDYDQAWRIVRILLDS